MRFFDSYAVDETEQEIGIYLPGGEGWFRYALQRITKPFLDGGTHQNQDLWRLQQLYLCRKTEHGFERIYDFPITNAGEWECAVKIAGTPDFHGGFHGYEHMTDWSLIPEQDRILFSQKSRIVLQGTKDEPVAVHHKDYEFKDGVLTLRQHLEWERDVHIDRAFLTMLPIRRKDGDFSICDTALYQGKEYNISQEGHETPLSPGCTQKLHEITVCGKQSGICATVTSSFCHSFCIQNTAGYNKLYFCYAKDACFTKGDTWNTESTFRFAYRNPEA